MTTQPKHNITAEGATDLLKDGRLLTDVYVDGELKIETNDNWNKEAIFKNCAVGCFSESVMQFDKPVKLINCYFKNYNRFHLLFWWADTRHLHF
jgi:hypothetical protein